ncbi:hypothetical protein KP509_34G042500 [Ceratopteris richardii]|uniref:BZIP domain-containing protein n=1 Tax=Ceratopteris richardii TaxID=49495 RepID=A0A8T2QKZ0_CERRI|nr:hypothetical protein KP509_34G042500 [Ceratopteris richardii]
MASSARAQFIAQPVEDAFDFSKMGDPDDWVSLFLSDVGLDVAEEAHPTSVSSLSSFPLPDLDDVDFISLEGSATSHGVSSDSALCRSEMLQEPFCPRLQQIDALPCPNFSQNCDPAKDNRISHSPESGLSHTGPECQEIDTSIPNMDSCSDEDSFYFFVSDICSEDTSTAETEPYNLINTIPGSDSVEHSKDSAQTKIDLLQSLNSEQNRPIGSDKALVSMGSAASSRKRKHLDQATRSSTSEGATDTHNEQSSEGTEVKDEEDERRRARLMRNRESAQLSRQRKKIYVDELEEKIKTMASTIAELNNTISLISAENINLRRQLGMFGPSPGQAGGLSTAMPWMSAYPPGAMMGSRYMMPGSQVPLVPIPKWKSQQSTTLKKSRKPKLESEKGGMEEASKKTKKAAGVAVAGLFMFVFILLPINFQFMGLGTIIPKESKIWPTTPSGVETNKVVLRAGGRVLTGLTEESKFSSNEFGSGIDFRSSQAFKTREPDPQQVEKPLLDANGADQKHRYRENASTPLAATLFVPRNDQLVRIEGNLIINSVLAGFEAADSLNQSDKKTARERTLYDRTSAVDANLKAVALKAAPKEQGALVELQRALAGRLRFDLDASDIKSIEEDGSLHQWFIEDFTGAGFTMSELHPGFTI